MTSFEDGKEFCFGVFKFPLRFLYFSYLQAFTFLVCYYMYSCRKTSWRVWVDVVRVVPPDTNTADVWEAQS